MVGSNDPPIMLLEVFIQPGGLQGLAMILICGLACLANNRKGIMSV